MPRPEKVQAVAEIKERLEGAQAVFLAEYAGLSVKDQQVLRRELRASGAEFKVVKMTLARRAADDLEIETLDELLLGPTGLAFADGDPVGAAKVLKDFAKSHEVFVIKGGLLGLEFLTPEKISELADIEPREVLLSKLAGAMKAPMANLAGLLAALPRNTASVLSQLLERKESAEPVTASADAQPDAETEDDTDKAPAEVAADTAGDADTSGDDEPDDATAVAEDSDAVAGAPSEDAAEDPDVTEETEDDADATVTASDDSADETVNEHDEASDDAEEK
ncbi:MAG TPA: 50S ribosomal protein L10 [Acidimicrobiia bacterium]|nr:50S ribosomal protein L10 [Acidimicrobiia bacterium]